MLARGSCKEFDDDVRESREELRARFSANVDEHQKLVAVLGGLLVHRADAGT
jgi:hypothetical protein